MFVLRVTAQGCCNNTDLPPNSGLIWKINKPEGIYKSLAADRRRRTGNLASLLLAWRQCTETHMSYRSLPAEVVLSALRSMMYISYCENMKTQPHISNT